LGGQAKKYFRYPSRHLDLSQYFSQDDCPPAWLDLKNVRKLPSGLSLRNIFFVAVHSVRPCHTHHSCPTATAASRVSGPPPGRPDLCCVVMLGTATEMYFPVQRVAPSTLYRGHVVSAEWATFLICSWYCRGSCRAAPPPHSAATVRL